MATATSFLTRDATTSLPKEATGATSSAGSANANQIVALNSAGQIDSTMLPNINALSFTASEAIAANALVNIWNNAGAAAVRNANATDATKPCHGYAPSAIANGASGTINFSGTNMLIGSGITPGATYYLGTTAGSYSSTAPSGAGNLIQPIGFGAYTSEIAFTAAPGNAIIHG